MLAAPVNVRELTEGICPKLTHACWDPAHWQYGLCYAILLRMGDFILIFSIVSYAVMSLLSVLAAPRVGRAGRTYFLWVPVFLLLPLAANVFTLVRGLGDTYSRAGGNFVPFTAFMNLFFLPAAILIALIGFAENYNATVEQRPNADTPPETTT